MRIYLSYASVDSESFQIHRIFDALGKVKEIEKVYCWENDTHIDFVTFMADSIRDADIILVFCSEGSSKSEAVKKEWMMATYLNKPIVPIFKKNDDVPPLLRPQIGMQYNENFDKFISDLIKLLFLLISRNQEIQKKVLEPPVESYHGSEPYAYVSYSHKDKEIVYPIIQELARNGIRIWYDEGIIPTNEWQSVIADALQKSSICLCFLSRNAVESRFVGNEINFVISHNIKILPIYLEKFVMPAQYELLLGNIQGLIKHVFEDKIFFEKLLGFLNPLLNPKMEEEPIKIAKKQKSAEEKEKGIIAFISYSHKDGELFQIPEIAEKLKKLPGISEVLYSEKNVVDDFVEYMNKMLGAADIMLLFCSANSRESKFVNREWQAAYANDVPILPVFLEKKEIPFLLRSIDGVLFKPFNTDITVQSIHATIFKKLRKQSPKPVATPQVVLSETEMLDKLNTLLAMAQEIYIDDIANALGITRAEFFNKLALWGKKSRIPFKINKDVILPS